MKCPECGYESIWTDSEVYSREHPCCVCGFDMDGAEFYNEATSVYVDVKDEQ